MQSQIRQQQRSQLHFGLRCFVTCFHFCNWRLLIKTNGFHKMYYVVSSKRNICITFVFALIALLTTLILNTSLPIHVTYSYIFNEITYMLSKRNWRLSLEFSMYIATSKHGHFFEKFTKMLQSSTLTWDLFWETLISHP